MWTKLEKYRKVSICQFPRKYSDGNIFSKALTPPFFFIQPVYLFCHSVCFLPPLSPPLLTHLVLILPLQIAQSHLRIAVSRMCRKDNAFVSMYWWCWMIGRWCRSIPLEACSMALCMQIKTAAQSKIKTPKQYLSMSKGTSARSLAEGQNLAHAG